MSLITVIVYLSVACLILVPLAIAAFFLFTRFRTGIQKQNLLKSGISMPAEILASKYNFRSKSNSSFGKSYQHNVTFDLKVMPNDRPHYQTQFTTFLHSREDELIRPGKKIWLRVDPSDSSKMAFEYFNSEKMMLLEEDEWKEKRDIYEALEKQYAVLRVSGEQALATIIEKEDIIDIGTDMGKGTVYRLKFDITPNSGSPFQAETQAVMQIDKKYDLGKKVYVRFDRKDLAVVALDRSAESMF